MNKMIMAPVRYPWRGGPLPADYMDPANKGLSTFLAAYCVKGKIKMSVALARSSLTSQAGDAEVNTNACQTGCRWRLCSRTPIRSV